MTTMTPLPAAVAVSVPRRRAAVSPEIPLWMDIAALLLTGFFLLPLIVWYRLRQFSRHRAGLLKNSL